MVFYLLFLLRIFLQRAQRQMLRKSWRRHWMRLFTRYGPHNHILMQIWIGTMNQVGLLWKRMVKFHILNWRI